MLKLALALLLAPATLFTPLFAHAHATGSIHTPQVDLGYETFGSPTSAALPILAVNGGPGLSHIYMLQNDMWQRIAAHRLVVFYDQRGTGASKHVAADAPQSLAAQVEDLEAVRAHLHLEKFALLGDSYGGVIAMAYATAHPEHLARLILSDSAPPSLKSMVHLLPDVFPDLQEQYAAEAKTLAGDPEAAAQASLRDHFRMIFYSPEKRDAYLAHAKDLGFVPAVSQAIFSAPGAQDTDLTPSLATIHTPTLVITGRFDMNVAPIVSWRIAHAIAGAKIVFFEKSGHLPSYEEPDRYIQVLEAFLNQP